MHATRGGQSPHPGACAVLQSRGDAPRSPIVLAQRVTGAQVHNVKYDRRLTSRSEEVFSEDTGVRYGETRQLYVQASGRGRVYRSRWIFPILLFSPARRTHNTRVYKVCTAATTMSSEAAQLVTDVQSLSVSGAFDKFELYLTCGSLMTRCHRSLAAPSLVPD